VVERFNAPNIFAKILLCNPNTLTPYNLIMSKIKLIVFDLDGTLVDAYKAVMQSLNFALPQLGYKKMTLQNVKRRVGWGETKLVKALVHEDHVQKALSLYRLHHKEALPKGVKFLPGAKNILPFLKKKGYLLGIASNRPTLFTLLILKALDIRPYFQTVLCGDKVSRPKPSGIILKSILDRHSMKPSQALYVGDMTIDVLTGKRARVKTVAVTTGSSSRAELVRAEPFKLISQINHLKAILDGCS